MSELPDMISAVVGDKKVEAETSFKNTMAQKIGGALDRSSKFFDKRTT